MAEINLLQQEQSGLGKLHFRKPSQFTLYFMIGLVAFELAIFAVLNLSGRKVEDKLAGVRQESADIDLEISKNDDQRKAAITVQQRLRNLDNLLDYHILWSQLFSEFEKKSYKPVQLETLSVDYAASRLILSGVAATQADLAKFMLGLETSPTFLSVILKSAAAEQTETAGFLFNMEVIVDPRILR